MWGRIRALGCVPILSLPLGLVVVCVAAIQFTENLPDTRGQRAGEELDVLLHTEVQDLINALCKVTLDFRLQRYLGNEKGMRCWEEEEGGERHLCTTQDKNTRKP